MNLGSVKVKISLIRLSVFLMIALNFIQGKCPLIVLDKQHILDFIRRRSLGPPSSIDSSRQPLYEPEPLHRSYRYLCWPLRHYPRQGEFRPSEIPYTPIIL